MDAAVDAYLRAVTPERRRRDAQTMVELMGRSTGVEASMWGTIVGYGRYHYQHASG